MLNLNMASSRRNEYPQNKYGLIKHEHSLLLAVR